MRISVFPRWWIGTLGTASIPNRVTYNCIIHFSETEMSSLSPRCSLHFTSLALPITSHRLSPILLSLPLPATLCNLINNKVSSKHIMASPTTIATDAVGIKNHLASLPTDVRLDIISLLPPVDQVCLALTSHFFNDLILSANGQERLSGEHGVLLKPQGF